MGQQHSSKKGLEGVTQRAESRIGQIPVTGRYHRLPKTLEQDYKIATKVLGSGYNGQVHLAESIADPGKQFAVKGFKLHGVTAEKKEELESEAEIFLAMDHPHVGRLVDVYESTEELTLVMECMTGGELFERVKQKKRFAERDAANAAYQMLLAVNYIHSHGVVHRDIKLENFLYESETSDYLKLIDFGFSKIWAPNTKMALSCGTLSYVAPEVLERSYTSQCDLWSFGVTVFILLFGYMPFSGSETHQIRIIKEGKYVKKKAEWDRVSEDARQFVQKLLVVDPQERLTAEQALKHPWIEKRADHSTDQIDQSIMDGMTMYSQASSFRRACMTMMAWSLTAEERATVRQAFEELDTEHKGVILMKDFRRILEEKFHITDAQAAAAFNGLDLNHTEEVHYSEFLAAMMTNRIAVHDRLLQNTFRRFDTDNTGYITAENLKEVLGESFDGQETAKMLEEVDKSHDGKISYEEFIAYLKHGGGHDDDNHAHVAAKVVDTQLKKHDSHNPGMRLKSDAKLAGNAAPAAAPAGNAPASNAKKEEGKKCCTVL